MGLRAEFLTVQEDEDFGTLQALRSFMTDEATTYSALKSLRALQSWSPGSPHGCLHSNIYAYRLKDPTRNRANKNPCPDFDFSYSKVLPRNQKPLQLVQFVALLGKGNRNYSLMTSSQLGTGTNPSILNLSLNNTQSYHKSEPTQDTKPSVKQGAQQDTKSDTKQDSKIESNPTVTTNPPTETLNIYFTPLRK
ncbi:unnamed protein product [Allacma fusca]|uniref:Uncharacterized protein n=1 Tax=Allacma fusca TaxID=39272 RepID=A0A8J2LDP3_9HEXA|nr:unnamed protein product [Allacma fusca]